MNVDRLLQIAIALGSATAIGAAAPLLATENAYGTESDHPVTDTWITTKVKTELAATQGVESMAIDVDTRNGMVTLTGVQPTDAAVQKAVAVARRVKGVESVDSSGLKIGRSSNRDQPTRS